MQTEKKVLENVKYPSDWHIGLSSDLARQFNEAVICARDWTQSPPEALFNQIISLYKQAVVGDCTIERPQGHDYNDAVLQWVNWHSLKGLSRDEAAKRFVSLVSEHTATYNVHAPGLNKPPSRGHFRAHFLAPLLQSESLKEPVLHTDPSELLVDENNKRR